MILYKPVLIESAEQAEALPEGTLAFKGDKTGRCMDRTTNYPWQRGRFPTTDLGMVGWTALVPIEAEEQRITSKLLEDPPDSGVMRAFLAGETPADMTRLVTPWEEA